MAEKDDDLAATKGDLNQLRTDTKADLNQVRVDSFNERLESLQDRVLHLGEQISRNGPPTYV